LKISLHQRHREIIELLETHFITYEPGGLTEIYRQLIEFSFAASRDEQQVLKPRLGFSHLGKLHKSYREVIEETNKKDIAVSFATDLPVFLKSYKGKDAPVLMVCAMDSLPPEPVKNAQGDYLLQVHQNKNFNLRQEVGFWAPFSLIENNTDTNALFFNEMLQSYSLYVTDIYKLFFYIDKNLTDKSGKAVYARSNSLSSYRSLPCHASILSQEIGWVEPSCILTLGNNAGNALLGLYGKKLSKWTSANEGGGVQVNRTGPVNHSGMTVPVISVPHISGAANGAKSVVLNHPMWNNISGGPIVKYANIVKEAIHRNG